MRLIDADALKQVTEECIAEYDCYTRDTIFGMRSVVYYATTDAPAVDAVPVRHGKWIYGNEFHWYTASCNKCGYKRTTDIKAANWNAWKYCPNCGARMDEE